jgi:predicted nucleic acid-binding protein
MRNIDAMYVDTSALVKLYVEEPDSDACEATVAGNPLASSSLLYCEFRSALLGKLSRMVISRAFLEEVWEAFEDDIAVNRIHLIPVNDRLVNEAAGIVDELYPSVRLRTLDALHLATYKSVLAGPLFSRDIRMLQAAARMGLTLAG